MFRRLAIAGAVIALLVGATGGVYAQDTREWIGNMFFRQASPKLRYNGTLAFRNAGDSAAAPISASTITASTIVTSGVYSHVAFYSAVEHCKVDGATQLFLPVRLAANDWALARTAGGAETYNIRCSFPLPWRSTAGKGARIDGFKISQQITVAALTSNTFNALATTTYANNTANLVAAHGGAVTITMPTATQANPYLTTGTVGTPTFMNLADTQVNMDFTVVMANTGIYRLYGVSLTYSVAL